VEAAVSRLVYTSGCIEVFIDSRYRWMPSLTKLSGPKYKLAHATPGAPEFVAGLVYERTIEPDTEVAEYSAEKIKDGDFFFVSESHQIVSHCLVRFETDIAPLDVVKQRVFVPTFSL
jgi:hypothetical protein